MKKIIFSLGLLFSLSSVFSQSFMQGAGVSFFGITPTHDGFLFNESLTYSPRFNFFEADKLSVSVGVPLSFGLSSGAHDVTYDDGSGYPNTISNSYFGVFVNAPVYFNFNFGRGATKHNTDPFGFFVGAGYGFYAAAYATDDNGVGGVASDNESGTSTGLALDAGVRLGVGRKHIKKPKNIEIRMSYMSGSSDLIKSLYGLGCSFNF